MKRVAFFLPVTSQPRYHKRIKAFQKAGYDNLIFSFERNYFKGDGDISSFISLGKIEHEKYLKRMFRYLKVIKIIKDFKRQIKECEIIYIFGLDLVLFIVILSKLFGFKQKIIYEVADIRSIMIGNSFKSRMMRFLERKAISKVNLTTVTSPYFIEGYYEKEQRIHSNNFFVLENKLYNLKNTRYCREMWNDNSPLVIGLFGVIRCKYSWNIICELAERYPNKINIYVRGYVLGIESFQSDVERLDNIVYEGEYTSPDDLAYIYSKIDICWVGNITNENLNTKLALPNRLYESLYYRVPMVAHKGSGVSKRIEELDAGWIVDFKDVEGTIHSIISISKEEYQYKKKNTVVSDNLCVDSHDHLELIQKVQSNG